MNMSLVARLSVLRTDPGAVGAYRYTQHMPVQIKGGLEDKKKHWKNDQLC